MLFSICYNKTQDEWASEEIVQNIFTNLCKRGGQLEVHTSIKAYLIKSVKTAIIKYYREKARIAYVSQEDIPNAEGSTPHINRVDYNLVASQFLEEDVEELVGRLPKKCQHVYRLSRENNLSTKEIAEAMQISPKTVKNHLTKALSLLRNESKFLLNS